MSFISKLFAKKEGGTFVGNLIRSVVNTKTAGALGNGVMLTQPGETQEQYNQRMLASAGAGVAAAQNAAAVGTGNSFIEGFASQNLKTIVPWIIAGFLAVLGFVYIIVKRK